MSGEGVQERIPEVGVGNSGWTWAREAPREPENGPEEGRQSRGRRRIGAYRSSSMTIWLAPVPVPELC